MKVSLLFIAATLFAQGVPTEWEARKKIDVLSASVGEVEGTLGRLDVERWKKALAPDAYLEQLESAKRQLVSSRQALAELRENPEKLSTAFEIFLRFESLDFMLNSVREAARKYENPEVADDLEAKLGASLGSRDQFRNYLLDLAKERDAQFAVLVKEAQRCRTEVNAPPAPAVRKKAAAPAPTPVVNKP
jgi:hypothetical protein